MAARKRQGSTATDLPFAMPIAPMLAALANEVPAGDFFYEPKWDGFRAMPARTGPAFEIWSRQQRPFARATPASFVAFDLLALDGRDLRGEPFARRREGRARRGPS